VSSGRVRGWGGDRNRRVGKMGGEVKEEGGGNSLSLVLTAGKSKKCLKTIPDNNLVFKTNGIQRFMGNISCYNNT